MPLPKNQKTFPQSTTATITGTIVDENGSAIALSNIDSLTMNLYDHSSGESINNRDGQDILNVNDVTVHSTSGLFTWLVQRADNPITNKKRFPPGSCEKHAALIEWEYGTNTKFGHEEFEILVENIRKVENV